MGAKAKHDFSPMLRRNFIEALKEHARNKGKTIAQVMEGWIEEDWKAVLNAMSKFAPRETKVTGNVSHKHEHTHEQLSDTSAWIEGGSGTGQEGETQEPSENRSLLSAEIPLKSSRH